MNISRSVRAHRAIASLATLVMLAALPVLTAVAQDGAEPGFCPINLAPVTPGTCTNGGAADAGGAPSPYLPDTAVGNPISLVTGDKRQSETDLDLDGAPLGFRRHYASSGADDNVGLGHGWRHSFLVQLSATADGGRRIVDSTGRYLYFARSATGRAPAPSGTGVDGTPGIWTSRLASDGYLLERDGGSVWVVPDGRRLSFRGSYLVRIDWPDQRALTFTYRARRLDSATDERGRRLAFEYTPGQLGLPAFDPTPHRAHAGHLSAVLLPDGRRIEYDYDDRQNLTRARFADGTAREYHYEDALWPSHLTGVTERTGVRSSSWRYDERGRAVFSSRAEGIEQITVAIEAPEDTPGGRVGDEGRTVVTDGDGAESVYRWRRDPRSGASLLIEARGAGCPSCPPTGRAYAYDADGRLIEATRLDADGRTLGGRRHAYDERGRIVRVSDIVRAADGGTDEHPVERLDYDGDSSRPSRVIRPSVAPDGDHVTETVYTPTGLIASITERGFAPVFDDAALEGTAPDRATPDRGVPDQAADRRPDDPTGKPAPSAWVPIVRTTRFEHESGRLIAVDGPRDDVDDVTRFEWDGSERLVAVRPSIGPAMRVTGFDALGRPNELRVGDREPLRLERDATGAVVVMQSGERTVRHERDAEGRTMAIVGPDGRTARIERDAAGQMRSFDDGAGRLLELARGAGNRLVESRSLASDGVPFRTLSHAFDTDTANGSTDVDGWLHHDDFGRVVLSGDADTGAVVHAHDASGNDVERRLADGTVTRVERDAAGHPVSRRDADGTVTRWRWDAARDLLLETSTAATVERFTYDAADRLISHVRKIDGQRFETAYTYDERGRVLDKRLPDGQVLRHQYHESGPNAGRLRTITRRGRFGIGGDMLAGEIDLDRRDGESGWTTLAGSRAVQRFAPNGEIRSLTVENTLAIDYAFDAAGDLVGMDIDGAASRYGYRNDRLRTATTPAGDYRWRYDASGNRVEEHVVAPGGEPSWTYSEHAASTGSDDDEGGNRLQARATLPSGEVETWRHDANGAPLVAGPLRYTRDARGRALTVSRGGTLIATYAYNAFGQRIRKSVHTGDGPPAVTRYLYDGIKLAAEIDASGALVSQYVYLDGHRPIALLAADEAYAIHTDHLGTPRLMTDEDGTAVWAADYAPFGEATVTLDTVPLALRLPGQYADAETGLHYNHFRDYDPTLGRYLSADPAGRVDGPNRYLYALARPLERTDVLGLWSRGDSLSPERLAELDNNPAAIARFVTEELSGFSDRQRFYDYAHQTLQTADGAIQTDWFRAASEVNRWNELGPADYPSALTPLGSDSDDYLTYAGIALALQNVQTFATLMRGDDIAGVGCLRGDELDIALVGYEQRQLSRITDFFFGDRSPPGGPPETGANAIYGNAEAAEIVNRHFGNDFRYTERDREAVVEDLNSLTNYEGIGGFGARLFGSEATREVILTLFPDGFDISREADRIKLGQALIRRNNGQPWEDPALYD